ncbi:hypothetical protein CC80DRAFT_478844, partial [Byssothecium circinans]
MPSTSPVNISATATQNTTVVAPNAHAGSITPGDPLQGDSMSAVSNTSTQEYQQEPFSTFQHKVKKLCEKEFDTSDIEVEYMKGGSFNRVVGVTVTSPKTEKNGQYVVRISRDHNWDSYGIPHQLSILNFVRHLVKKPIPRIVAFGLTAENDIGSPYTIQERLTGQNMLDAWLGLNRAQRLSAIRLIIVALHDLGFLPDDEKFHFCHLDLFPRNMLINIVGDQDDTVELSAVLDWDAMYSFFCPKFTAFGPPFWIWNSAPEDSNEVGNNEELALTVPRKDEDIEMKKLFDEFASEEWKRFAYTPEYIVARRLFRYLKNGIRSNEDMNDIENAIKDW